MGPRIIDLFLNALTFCKRLFTGVALNPYENLGNSDFEDRENVVQFMARRTIAVFLMTVSLVVEMSGILHSKYASHVTDKITKLALQLWDGRVLTWAY